MPKISFITRLTEFIAPRKCAICGCRMGVMEDDLCASCNARLPRTRHYADPTDNEMARLFYGKIPVERCAALFFYEARSQADNLIYDLKYASRPEIGETLGRLIAHEMSPHGFFDGIDVIIPMPLANVRERQRGYNQSLEIARGLRAVTHIPINCKAVRRLTFGESLTKMDFRERMEAVQGAFKLHDGRIIKDKHVLLVDDVVTTGATTTACARELLKVDGVRISIVSAAFTKN